MKNISNGSKVLSKIARKIYDGEEVSASLMKQITQSDYNLVKAEAQKLEIAKNTAKIPDSRIDDALKILQETSDKFID